MSDPQTIQITAEPDLNPDRCHFRTDRTLFTGTLYTSDPDWATEWAPLAAAIFRVGHIAGVRITHGELLVKRSDDQLEWRDLARQIGAAIRGFVETGEACVKDGAVENLAGDDALRSRAQRVIEETLNPALAAHGGFVEIRDSDGKDLYITMGGGCQGCSAAAATMRQGVETAIRESVPEIENIYDATDHTAGINPYM